MSILEMPIISVLTTFHNAESTLGEAIDSICRQDMRAFELILVDDGSTDRSAEVAQRFSDPRVRLLQPGRVGRSAALNLGLAFAQGTFVGILDADDRAATSRLGEQVSYLLDHPDITLVASDARLIDREGKFLGEMRVPLTHDEIVADLLSLNPFAHSSVAFRRDIALAIGGYNEKCIKSIDFNFYLALIACGQRFGAIPKLLIDLRYYPDSWGRRDDDATQIRFGILGLVNLRAVGLGKVSLFALSPCDWMVLQQLFDEWFERRGFLLRHRSQKYLSLCFYSCRNWSLFSAIKYALISIKYDPYSLFRRGLGFIYSKDTEDFLCFWNEAVISNFTNALDQSDHDIYLRDQGPSL